VVEIGKGLSRPFKNWGNVVVDFCDYLSFVLRVLRRSFARFF